MWAEITPPDYYPGSWDIPVDLLSVELYDTDNNGTYEGLYKDFIITGTYLITFHAMNTEGVSSLPKYATVTQKGTDEADDYEDDNTFSQANVININDDTPQRHSFHNIGDEDWVKFYGRARQTYVIKAGNLDVFCEPIIELYDSDGITKLDAIHGETPGEDRILNWKCLQDALFYVYSDKVSGELT